MDIALFSPSSLFSEGDGEEDHICTGDKNTDIQDSHVERRHQFPGVELIIREFSFHQLNANLLWPGTFAFAEWLVQHKSCIEGRRTIELGSGTGALAIFLRKSFHLDITTSDYDDKEIEENIAHNCTVNKIPAIPHVRHTWGDKFPNSSPDWDLIIASDILLSANLVSSLILKWTSSLPLCYGLELVFAYFATVVSGSFSIFVVVATYQDWGFQADVKQYSNLIQTISFLLKCYKPSRGTSSCPPKENNGDMVLPKPAFLMSWRRRIGKEDESLFFNGCEGAGLQVRHMGSRVYCIKPQENEKSET